VSLPQAKDARIQELRGALGQAVEGGNTRNNTAGQQQEEQLQEQAATISHLTSILQQVCNGTMLLSVAWCGIVGRGCWENELLILWYTGDK
jgi:hypothetical protein